MRVLVTGSQGFIGSVLVDRLKLVTNNVIELDIKLGQDILTCDLPDCDVVVHLAAMTGVRDSITNPLEYWNVNVDGTRRILEHYKNTRVLVAGSSSQYEPHLNPYAATKHVIENIPHSNVCFMRFHTVYSSTPRSGMFFDKLINGTLEYVTDHERDFIHVDDLCSAVILIMNSNLVGPVDVGTGTCVKISDIITDLPLLVNTPYERQKTQANIDIITAIGFTPAYSVMDFLDNVRR